MSLHEDKDVEAVAPQSVVTTECLQQTFTSHNSQRLEVLDESDVSKVGFSGIPFKLNNKISCCVLTS